MKPCAAGYVMTAIEGDEMEEGGLLVELETSGRAGSSAASRGVVRFLRAGNKVLGVV